MRGIVGTVVAIALLAGGATKATAQSMAEFALTLVILADSDPAQGRLPTDRMVFTYDHFQSSAAFKEACDVSSDLEPVCDAIASIEPGTPAADVIKTLAESGWEFEQAWPVKFGGPDFNADDNALAGLDVIFTATTADAGSPGFEARQIGCDFSSGDGLTTVLQRSGDADTDAAAPATRDAPERCVDSIQDALDAGLSVRNALDVDVPLGKALFFPIVNHGVPTDQSDQAPRVGYAELYTLRLD